jgi:hypothetical protein
MQAAQRGVKEEQDEAYRQNAESADEPFFGYGQYFLL